MSDQVVEHSMTVGAHGLLGVNSKNITLSEICIVYFFSGRICSNRRFRILCVWDIMFHNLFSRNKERIDDVCPNDAHTWDVIGPRSITGDVL